MIDYAFMHKIFPGRYSRENKVINKLLLIAAMSLLAYGHAFGQGDRQFRLVGVVKRSSSIQLSNNKIKGISYHHNSHKGTQVRVNNLLYEYHSPVEFQIPLKSRMSVVTIQTI